MQSPRSESPMAISAWSCVQLPSDRRATYAHTTFGLKSNPEVGS